MASIMVSEADPDVRRLLVVLMERLGHEAVVLDGLEVPPRGDLLLLEPACRHCIEQARVVRMLFPELPIVCMGVPPADADFLGDGPLRYLEKPFTVDELARAVTALLPAASPV
jgi:CheY-like chemotaxis protein